MTDVMRDEQLDREIRGFLAEYAEDVSDAPSASEIAMRLSSRLETRMVGLRLNSGLAWVALAALAALALLGVVLIGTLLQKQSPQQYLPRPPLALGTPTNGLIAYSTRARSATTGVVGEIYVAEVGMAPKLIAGGGDIPATCPAFSPDGTRLSYLRASVPVVVAGDFSGAVRVEGGFDLSDAVTATCPVWSPAGDALAVLVPGEIRVFGLDGTRATLPVGDSQLLEFGGGDLVWSPDGTRFAVGMDDGIWIVPFNGAPYRLTTTAAYDPAWSPDGSHLVFYVPPDARDGQMTVVALSDRHEVILSREGSTPVWSPDGEDIAYMTDGGVAIQQPDGSGRRVVGADGAYAWGGWSPDGRQILQMFDVSGFEWDLRSATTDGASTAVVVARIGNGSARNFPKLGDVSWQPVYP